MSEFMGDQKRIKEGASGIFVQDYTGVSLEQRPTTVQLRMPGRKFPDLNIAIPGFVKGKFIRVCRGAALACALRVKIRRAGPCRFNPMKNARGSLSSRASSLTPLPNNDCRTC